jgi:hypothetical protein
VESASQAEAQSSEDLASLETVPFVASHFPDLLLDWSSVYFLELELDVLGHIMYTTIITIITITAMPMPKPRPIPFEFELEDLTLMLDLLLLDITIRK